MKRAILFFWITGMLALIPSTVNAQLNLDFEQWTDSTFYEEPEGYSSFNFQAFMTTGAPNVTKVDGQSDNAIRLETIEADTDTMPGLVTNSGSFNFFQGGIAYTEMPDSVRITARYDVAQGDSASLWLIFHSMGIPQLNQANFGGTDTNWATYTFPLNIGLPPDTLGLLLSSSNIAATPVPGSWIEVDDIEFVGATDQLVNNEFDNWLEVQSTEPDGWFSVNTLLAIFGNAGSTASVVQSTDASSGTYACEINTIETEIFGTTDTFGFLSNASFFTSGSESGVPFTGQPSKMTFDYKYEPQGNDSALVWVIFGSAAGDSINGSIDLLAQSSTYSTYEIEYDWTGKDDPDSLLIVFSSSNEFGGTISVGSKLTIDNIQFEYPSGFKASVPGLDNGVSLYPNPAGNVVHFRLSEEIMGDGTLRIYDMIGRLLEETTVSGTAAKAVDISKYDAGQYLYELKVDESVYSGKFVKQ